MSTPEGNVLNACCEYLALTKQVFWRVNTSGLYREGRFFALPKHSLRGVSDIIVLRPGGKAVFIECKSDVGRQSPQQKEFERLVTSVGCEYHVVRGIETLRQAGF